MIAVPTEGAPQVGEQSQRHVPDHVKHTLGRFGYRFTGLRTDARGRLMDDQGAIVVGLDLETAGFDVGAGPGEDAGASKRARDAVLSLTATIQMDGARQTKTVYIDPAQTPGVVYDERSKAIEINGLTRDELAKRGAVAESEALADIHDWMAERLEGSAYALVMHNAGFDRRGVSEMNIRNPDLALKPTAIYCSMQSMRAIELAVAPSEREKSKNLDSFYTWATGRPSPRGLVHEGTQDTEMMMEGVAALGARGLVIVHHEPADERKELARDLDLAPNPKYADVSSVSLADKLKEVRITKSDAESLDKELTNEMKVRLLLNEEDVKTSLGVGVKAQTAQGKEVFNPSKEIGGIILARYPNALDLLLPHLSPKALRDAFPECKAIEECIKRGDPTVSITFDDAKGKRGKKSAE